MISTRTGQGPAPMKAGKRGGAVEGQAKDQKVQRKSRQAQRDSEVWVGKGQGGKEVQRGTTGRGAQRARQRGTEQVFLLQFEYFPSHQIPKFPGIPEQARGSVQDADNALGV